MQVRARYGNLSNAFTTVNITDICPKCGRGIEPILKDSSYYKDDSQHILYLTLFCNACKSAWVDSYDYSYNYDVVDPRELNFYKEVPTDLPKDLLDISPQGARIYHQALQAEYDGYETLVGIGLRKSLEFFIKDYLVKLHSDKEDEIRKAWLGSVIKEYITDETLKKLSTATTYIGNDETHYTRIYTDRDLQDLKKFLSATLRYLEYQMTILDAQAFLDKKTQK